MYENIAFSGGSTKGYCYLGTFKAIEKYSELFKTIKNISGASIGSFFATLFNMDFKADELTNFLNLTVKLNDVDIETFFSEYGFSKGDDIITIFRNVIKNKYNPDITFKELYDLTNKNLYITITSLTECNIQYLSHHKYPNMKIIDAIRMSISIPFIFTPVKVNDAFYVDGGLFEKLPLKKFDLTKKTLGLKLIDNLDRLENTIPNKITCIEDYTMNILLICKKMIQSGENTENIDIIDIGTEDVNPVDFTLTPKIKLKMVLDGYKNTITFLKNKVK